MSKSTQFQKGNSGRPLGAKNKVTYLADSLEKLGIKNPAQLSVMVFEEAMKAKDFATAGRVAIEIMRLTYTPPSVDTNVSLVMENAEPLTADELRKELETRGISHILHLDH
jgi:hypothetical protein